MKSRKAPLPGFSKHKCAIKSPMKKRGGNAAKIAAYRNRPMANDRINSGGGGSARGGGRMM
tara:strand:+ start:3787 stop:3969 length:183 start_codon:yes stop_codon:yes gene_type:complete